MNPKTMCMGCMKEKQSRDPVCPLCGYDESERRSPLVLKHRTLLADQYVVGKVLGKPGGFGITYLGWDTRLETMVAIKEYLPRDNAGRDTDRSTVVPHSKEDGEIFRYGLEAFLLEARTLAKFDHSNVVRVRTFFEANGTAYLVMDYYDGMSLESYLLQKGGKVSEKLAVNIMMPVLDGLREVHEKGFLHRDIKPHNIYLTRNGKPILLDFGAARSAMGDRSRSLSVLLTPGYAPYEQYQRKGKQGVWTDIYACGATLYRMVIGKTPPEAIERERDDDLIAPSKLVNVSRGFQAAVIKSLEMEPSRRQQSVREFQDMMFSLVSPEPPVFESQPEHPKPWTPPPVQPSAPPPRQTFQPQPFPPPSEPEKKSPMLKWVVIGLIVIATAFIAYSMGRKQEIPPSSSTVKAEPASAPVAESEPAPVAQSEPEPAAEPEPAPEPAKRETQAGELFKGHISGMQFAYIPAGSFMMGSPAGEPDREDDETQHEVTLTKGFFMQTTEVTQGQWKEVMGNNPSYFSNCGDNCPVEQVSWDDAKEFIRKLNQKATVQYRLPTEAEWEYAARAGTTGVYGGNGNLDAMGWYDKNSDNKTHPVAQKQSNAWNIYDMHGNVWEWCQDWYGAYPSGSATDPVGPGTGSLRVIRGGSLYHDANYCRSADRNGANPSDRHYDLGFRLVCSAGHQ